MTPALTSARVGRIPLAPMPKTQHRGAHKDADTAPGKRYHLTARECEVIEAVIRTGTCVVAANVLGLSIKTVEQHMANAKARAEVGTNYQLIAAYVTAKLKG